MRGRVFTRELVLTGAVWKGGDQPSPTSPDDPGQPGGGGHDGDDGAGGKDCWCHLLECLLSERVIRPDLEKRLRAFGLNLGALRRCAAECCKDDPIIT